MEQITQELNMENHNLKTIIKIYNDSNGSNVFLNTYTMLDIEEGKKNVFSTLLKKYNYKNQKYIEDFVEASALVLAQQLFSSSLSRANTNNETLNSFNPIVEKAIYHENHRIVNIDSSYRENLLSQNQTYDAYTSSNMIIDLNDTLDNTVSLELANICVPFTFYNISKDQGNNYFYVYDNSADSYVKIEIEDGNYTNTSIISNINDALSSNPTIESLGDISFELNTTTNKITITNTNSSDNTGYNVIFYDSSQNSDYVFSDHCISVTGGSNVQSKVNHNLGWLLGFRNMGVENYDTISYTVAYGTTANAEALCHLPYTKYFIIVIDDMNKNQSNKSLVQISNGKPHMNNKKYFNDIDNSINCLNNSNIDSYINSTGTGSNYTKSLSAQNGLTKKQIYSSLQVNNYRASFNEINSKLSADLINDVFAIIPFETKSLVWGNSMFTSDKNKFKRKYNGPVDISKLNVKLLDDRGNLLNLNGADWSLSLISTHSYKK